MILKGIDRLMDLIMHSKYIVALTGAGISTNSGIPDFRGPDGLYSRQGVSPDKLFSIKHFKEDPAYFYEHIGDLMDPAMDAMPTKGHLFLKKLEDLGKLKTVVTQNIDGLHEKAGNTNVLNVHGNFNQFKCMETKLFYPTSPEIREAIRKKEVPKCPECGGVLKPNVVFFGEPVYALEKALTEVQKADVLLAMGTSLLVYPVAQLPSYIHVNTQLVIINNTETPYDVSARVVIREDIDEVVDKTGLLG